MAWAAAPGPRPTPSTTRCASLEVVAGVLLIAAAIALPLLIAWLLGWFARRSVTRRRRERALDMA